MFKSPNQSVLQLKCVSNSELKNHLSFFRLLSSFSSDPLNTPVWVIFDSPGLVTVKASHFERSLLRRLRKNTARVWSLCFEQALDRMEIFRTCLGYFRLTFFKYKFLTFCVTGIDLKISIQCDNRNVFLATRFSRD